MTIATHAAASRTGPRNAAKGDPAFAVLCDHASIEAIAAEWNALARRNCGPVSPFQRPEWALACAQAMQDGLMAGAPAIVTARRRGELVFVAPLAIRRLTGIVQAEWLGGRLAIYGDALVCPTEDASALVRGSLAFLRKRSGWISLEGLRPGSLFARDPELSSAKDGPVTAPVLDIGRHGGFAEWQNSKSKSTRKTWNRKERKLAEAGKVTFEFRRGPVAVEDLRRLFAMKRQWAAEQGVLSRSLGSPAFEQLVENLVCGEGCAGARLSVLKLDGQPVAMELGFVEKETYLSYLGAYETRFAPLSPGTLQMRRTIEACFGEGVALVDFMPPDDEYKRQWCNDTMPVTALRMALRPSFLGSAAARLHAADLPRLAARALPAALRPAIARVLLLAHPIVHAAAAFRQRVCSIRLAAAISIAGFTAAMIAVSE